MRKTQWFYKVSAEEFGPVPTKAIMRLFAREEIGLDNPIREVDRDEWCRVRDVAKDLDLDIDLAAPVTINPVSASAGLAAATKGGVATLSPPQVTPASPPQVALAIQATPAIEVPPPSPQRATSAASGWYCELHGERVGPLALHEVVMFVAQGVLKADHQVRRSSDRPWTTVAEELLLKPALEGARRSDQRNVIQPPPPEIESPSADPVGNDIAARGNGQYSGDQWYIKSLGRTAGPMPFSQMLELWHVGRLGPVDEARLGVKGRWCALDDLQDMLGLPEHPSVTEARKVAEEEARAQAAAEAKLRKSTPVIGSKSQPNSPVASVTPAKEEPVIRSSDELELTDDMGVMIELTDEEIEDAPKRKTSREVATITAPPAKRTASSESLVSEILSDFNEERTKLVRRKAGATSDPELPATRPALAESLASIEAPRQTPAPPPIKVPARATLPPPRIKQQSAVSAGLSNTIDAVKDLFSGNSGEGAATRYIQIAVLCIGVLGASWYGYQYWATSNSNCFQALKAIYDEYQQVQDKDVSDKSWVQYVANTKSRMKYLTGAITKENIGRDGTRAQLYSLVRKVPALMSDVRGRDQEEIDDFKSKIAGVAAKLNVKL